MESSPISLLDPSLIYRPEYEKVEGNIGFTSKKDKALFRNYDINENDKIKERVRQTYLKMHTFQTVDFVRRKIEYWTRFDKAQMTVMEALDRLNDLIDESDPDTDVPNIVHAFQTAERIRAAYPDLPWFHLTGLIHDLGKVMALIGEEQWAVVGDTFPVGCDFADSIVYRNTSFDANPDLHDPAFNTKNGMYAEHCGLNRILMSWGHDEYLYRVLLNHGTRLPKEGLSMIRFHSFYPWHTGNDYGHLCDEEDAKMLHWVQAFNKFDLYTKSDDVPNIDALRPYYQSLINQYIPGIVKW